MSTSAPFIRGFQLDSSVIGDAAKSVNLFRGDVNLPLKLVHLGGPQKLDLVLSGFYSSNVEKQVDVWNLEAPTSILGLGWSLPYDYISFNGNGTASWLEGNYTFYSGGNPHPLTLVSENKDAKELIFADPLNALWSIVYNLKYQSWTIIKDDGVTLIFGGQQSGQNTLQKGVCWGNWAGNSTNNDGNPNNFFVAWNLTSMTNVWGNSIRYWYTLDNQPVIDSKPMTDSKPVNESFYYTRACYLAKIVDAYGRSVVFNYGDKSPSEYQAPNVSSSGKTTGYQDRYETKYLAQIDLYGPNVEVGNTEGLYYSLIFDYDVKSLGSSASGSDKLTNTCKRYLTKLSQQRNGIDVVPAMEFTYDWMSNSPSAGRITSAIYPKGGQVKWTYSNLNLGTNDEEEDEDSVFNLTYTATRPSDYGDALPQLWFGGDYVIVGWYNGEDLILNIYSYGGRWTEPYNLKIGGVEPSGSSLSDKLAQIHVAIGSDFFALYFHNLNSVQDQLYIFQKTPNQFGHWTKTQKQINVNISSFVPAETTLVAGDSIVALHVGGDTFLHRFGYDRVHQKWSDDNPDSYQGASKIALAAANNTLFAFFFIEDGSQGYSFIYYLEPNQDWGSSYSNGTNPIDYPNDIEWNSSYAQSYWQLGEGFAVGTGLKGSEANLQIITWDKNFSGFSLIEESVSNGTAFSWVGGNVIFNGGTAFRYDGSTWHKNNDIGYSKGDVIAVSSDMVLRATPNADCFANNVLATFDVVENKWNIDKFPPSGGNPDTYAYSCYPQISGNFLTLSNRVYYRGVHNDWQPVASNNPLPDVYGSTVSNRGETFIAYQNHDNRENEPLKTYVAILKNGDILSSSSPPSYKNQAIQNEDGSAILCGGNAFATYDAEVDDFSKVGSFTLHRIVNYDLTNATKCAVKSLTIETGEQTLITNYNYETSQAVFDESGTVVQFPTVTATRISAVDGQTSKGKTIYEYYNGLATSTDNLKNCYSLANGYMHTVTEHNDQDDVVAITTNTWTGVTYKTVAEKGFCLLDNTVTLKSAEVVKQTMNLDVIPLDGSKATEKTTNLSLTQAYTYDPYTAYTACKTATLFNSQGEEETRKITLTYAWKLSQYAQQMTKTRQLQKLAQSVSSNNNGDVQAVVKTFSNSWGAWDEESYYIWQNKETTTASFNFDEPDSNSDWIRQEYITKRNSLGFIEQQEDALGTSSLTLYNADGFWPLSHLKNAKTAYFFGFQPYEDTSNWTFTNQGKIEAGDAHTGQYCAHLPSGATLSNQKLLANKGTWVFSCWVKGEGTDAKCVMKVGSNQQPITLSSGNEWQYVFAYLDVPTDNTQVSCSIINASGTLLLDEVRFTPLDCKFSAKVYDPNTYYEIARVGNNGETVRTFYDNCLRTVASSGTDENVQGLLSEYFTQSGLSLFTNKDLNSKLEIAASEGGIWDNFRDSNWTNRWDSSNASDWKIVNQALTLQTSQTQSVTLKDSTNWSNYAVLVDTYIPENITGNLGITIGKSVSIQWNQSKKEWELLINNAVVKSSSVIPETIMHWLVIAGENSLDFRLNDQQIFSLANADNANSIGGSLSLFASDAGVAFNRVLIAQNPLTKITYSDGTGRKIQTQQLADNQTIVIENIFDELGRSTIKTKPVIYEQKTLGYQANFVTNFDWQIGSITGDVANYYAGKDGRSDDNGYPYQRKQIEFSSLSRLEEIGNPGADFAIDAEDSHTSTYTYGVNGSSSIFDDEAEQNYNVKLATDPDGLVTATITDQLKNKLGKVIGESGLPEGSLMMAYLLDKKDNPATTHSPNYFVPPSGSASDWTKTRDYNYRNQHLAKTSNDEGNTQGVRDNLGRIRFVLIADGKSSDSINPNSESGKQTIIYTLYDALSRPIETGYYGVESLESIETYANDPTWPNDATNWRYRFTYDGSDSYDDGKGTPPDYAIGKLTQTITNNGKTEVTETSSYDIRGNVITYSLNDGINDTVVTTYDYDPMKRVKSVTYPAIGSLKSHQVCYAYDNRGLLASIGTSSQADYYAVYYYNAAGQIEKTTYGNSGDDPINRTYTYASPGWLKSITDTGNNGLISSEELFYNDSPGTATTIPKYNGSVSAIRYQRKSDSVDYTWVYGYDTFNRLQTVTLDNSVNRSYSYDANGNPLAITDKQETVNFTYNGSNRLNQSGNTTFSYAPSGEVQTAGNLSLSYDFTSHLTTNIQNSANKTYISLNYGSGVQRISKTVVDSNGDTLTSRRYLLGIHKGRQHPLIEQSCDSNHQTTEYRYIYSPGGLIAIETADDTYFILKDHQKSSRLCLTGGTANPMATFDYLPFGQPYGKPGGTNSDLLNYRYTGQEWDSEINLYNYCHRLYDPTIERFYSPDPKHQYFSPYLYVGDQPLLHVDPTGEFSFKHTWHSIEHSRTFGYAFSGTEIGLGVLLTASGVGAPLGVALIGGGAAGLNYTARAKNFNGSQFFQVDAAATVSTAEIAAGVAITTASFGGATTIGSTFIGAGVAGLGDTFYQINTDPNGKFNWKQWGIAEGIGAAVGFMIGSGVLEGAAEAVPEALEDSASVDMLPDEANGLPSVDDAQPIQNEGWQDIQPPEGEEMMQPEGNGEDYGHVIDTADGQNFDEGVANNNVDINDYGHIIDTAGENMGVGEGQPVPVANGGTAYL